MERTKTDKRIAIPYYRVSTKRQGVSGLGLEAQKQMVQACAKVNQLKLIGEFVEVESGARKTRPILKKALEICKRCKAILLIANQSRLSRSVLFIAQLEEAGIDFRSVDDFNAGKLIVHIKAAVDQEEWERASQRTRAALSVAKQHGVKLGAFGTDVLSKRNKRKAQTYARKMKPIINQLIKEGFTSQRALRDQLNDRQIATYSGPPARWHANTVFTLLKRINNL